MLSKGFHSAWGLKAITVPAGVYQVQTSDSGYQALAWPASSILDITILLNAFFKVHVIHSWLVFHVQFVWLSFFLRKQPTKTNRANILKSDDIIECQPWEAA